MAGTTINPYRFGGQLGYRTDGPNRLYIRARNLDTTRGQWISKDPVDIHAAGFNFYWYAKNNPLRWTDASGQEPFACEACAATIANALWCTPQHACSHAYIHCVSCCILARKYGPHCARYAQWWQNWLGDTAARSRWCEDGIKGIYHRGKSCTQYCLQKTVHTAGLIYAGLFLFFTGSLALGESGLGFINLWKPFNRLCFAGCIVILTLTAIYTTWVFMLKSKSND